MIMSDKKELLKKRYIYLDHTADAKFQAFGKNLEEAFSNAAIALFGIVTDVNKVSTEIEKKIRVVADKEQSLLYDFLEELIYLMDTEGYLVSKVSRLVIKKTPGALVLEATIQGDTADKNEVFSHIKAITYNDMFIIKEEGFVIVQAVPDL